MFEGTSSIFFLPHYRKDYPHIWDILCQLFQNKSGRLDDMARTNDWIHFGNTALKDTQQHKENQKFS